MDTAYYNAIGTVSVALPGEQPDTFDKITEGSQHEGAFSFISGDATGVWTEVGRLVLRGGKASYQTVTANKAMIFTLNS